MCDHVGQIDFGVVPSSMEGCSRCLATGDRWVHLRVCLACGEVGCCDSSRNRHASGHARVTGHALAMSFEPGEDWVWCYVDEEMVEVPGLPILERNPYHGEQRPV